MFHTLEIKYQLTKEEYDKLYKEFYKYDIKNGVVPYKNRNKKALCLSTFKDRGITWFLVNNIVDNGFNDAYYYYSIESRINPKALLDKDYINVANQDDIRDTVKVFNGLSKEISKHMPKFDEYKIKRIDYCINVDVKDLHPDIGTKEVMKLIKKADKPSSLEEYEYYDNISKRKKPYKDSYYLVNDSLHVNIYSKYEQLKNKMPKCEQIEEARDIIRFEVQCRERKIKDIRKAYDIEKNDSSSLLSDTICREILLSYYNKTIGSGDYYTLEKAEKIIEDSNFEKKEKNEMLNALKLISLKRSIYRVRETFDTKYKRKQFNDSLEMLRVLNINPVTIPNKIDIDYLPNLFTGINEKIKKRNSLKTA